MCLGMVLQYLAREFVEPQCHSTLLANFFFGAEVGEHL